LKRHFSNTFLTLVFIACSVAISAQSGVRFQTGSLAAMKQIAKEQNKNLFIDTYASWCIPCRRMDKVFAKKEVQAFFISNNEGIQIASDATKINTNPTADNSTFTSRPETVVKPKREKRVVAGSSSAISRIDDDVVYILGANNTTAKDAVFLKKEAYFKLELMDGTYRETARKYLETQPDWNTEENMRFILDFVTRPDSPMYDHIIANKQTYYSAFSKESVDNTLQILVYKHLYTGVPRPTMEDVIRYYIELGYTEAISTSSAEKYFIGRYKMDRQHEKAFDLSIRYLTETSTQDEKELVKFLDYTLDNGHLFSPEQLVKVADLAAVRVSEEMEDYEVSIKKIQRLRERANQ